MNTTNSSKVQLQRSESKVNVDWVKKMLNFERVSPTNTTEESEVLTWEHADDLREAWDQAMVSLKSASEVISNELKSYCEEVRSSPPCSTYDFETLNPSSSSPNDRNETKTFTVPGRSTPTFQSAEQLPFCNQSPIPVESIGRKHVGAQKGISRRVLKEKKDKKNFMQQCEPRTITKSNHGELAVTKTSEANAEREYDYQKSSWQTSELTRSEVEYQKMKNKSPTITSTEAASVIQVRVTSQVNILNGNQPGSVLKERQRRYKDKIKQNSRYNQMCEDLDEVKRLDYRMRGYMKQLYDDAWHERSSSRDVKTLSLSSNGKTACKIPRDMDKFLNRFPPKKRGELEALENNIRAHLIKIRQQIGLVEKYNRALLTKLSKPEVTRDLKESIASPSQHTNKKSRHGRKSYDECHLCSLSLDSIEKKDLIYKVKSTAENRTCEKPIRSNDQQHKESRKGGPKYGMDVDAPPKQRKGRRTRQDPPQEFNEYRGDYPTIDSFCLASSETVAATYERWTWSYERPLNNENIYKPPVPVFNKIVERRTCDQGTSTHKRRGKRDTLKDVDVANEKGGTADDYHRGRCRIPKKSTWDHFRLLDKDKNCESKNRHYTNKSTNVDRGEVRTSVEQGAHTDKDLEEYNILKQTFSSKSHKKGHNRGESRTTLKQETLTNQGEQDFGRVQQNLTDDKAGSRSRDRGKSRATLKQETVTSKDRDPSFGRRTFSRRSSTVVVEREKSMTLEQGTWTDEQQTRSKGVGEGVDKPQTRNKGVDKLKQRCDGWTLIESPKAREKEIQTISPMQVRDRSRSRSLSKSKDTRIPEKEMRERTARLRANDTVLLKRRREAEEKTRRAANILTQKTYANKIRSHRKGAGRNIDIPTDVSVLGDDDSLSLSFND